MSPRVLWVGVGCIRGISKQLLATAVEQVLKRYHLVPEAIAGLATIDIKAEEPGILEYCQERQLPLKTFPAALLSQVEIPNPSKIVGEGVGTPSVAEAAALLAVLSGGEITQLIVTKQVIEGAVTIAIAQGKRVLNP